MKLEPFASDDGHSFAASRADVLKRLGTPRVQGRNEVGLDEFDYGEIVFRFQDNGRLEEITAQAAVLHLGAVAVPFASLAAFVREHDGQAFERAGFVVSPGFGLAFDPRQPCWVTGLAAHCLGEWAAL